MRPPVLLPASDARQVCRIACVSQRHHSATSPIARKPTWFARFDVWRFRHNANVHVRFRDAKFTSMPIEAIAALLLAPRPLT